MQREASINSSVRSWLFKQAAALLLMAILLFGSAGRLDWAHGWLQTALYVGVVAAQAAILIPRNPALIAERSKVQAGTKGWDRPFILLAVALLPLAGWLIAGLDARNGWTAPLSPLIPVSMAVIWLLGYSLIIWAMASNPYFSTTVRIQQERGHTVATSGPYRIVRHPGYLGAIVYVLATPLLLGSVWVFIPCGLSAALYVVRTALEDRTLHNELEGYRAYAAQTRFRLLPGVW